LAGHKTLVSEGNQEIGLIGKDVLVYLTSNSGWETRVDMCIRGKAEAKALPRASARMKAMFVPYDPLVADFITNAVEVPR
jgi:hypothetical protein